MAQLSVDVRFRHDSGFAIAARFEAGAGITALHGPSGSGKSTILHLIAGVLRPAEGSIRLGAQTLVDTARGIDLPPERRRIGIVFQDRLLFPHMSVRRNLTFGMGRHPGSTIRFENVVDILEIGDLLPRLPATLSGGQSQRVALGRALLCSPELLLLDEPLTALDDELKERILVYLQRVFEEWHIPTIFVTHERAAVDRIADHVVSIAGGRVVEVTPVAEGEQ